tara:strand:- start:6011 stop:6724 length:714 start_codon:yes stop_codon:yes gene_type:complete
MVEPLSVASGVAGIITLSSAVVAAGYKYIDAVRSAPKEIKDLMREICFLNTIVSQLATHTLSTDSGSHPAFVALDDKHIFQDCEATLLAVQRRLSGCKLSNNSHGTRNGVRIWSWPMTQKEIIQGRERISRLCSILTAAITLDNATSLTRLEHAQQMSIEKVDALLSTSHDVEEQKILAWLSTLRPKVKHTATAELQQPGTCDWLLQEELIQNWMSGAGPSFVWLQGSSGCGKTVLV